MRLVRLAVLGLIAALLSACARHAPVSPSGGPATSSVKLADVLLVDIDDRSERQFPQFAPALFIDIGYVAGEYKIGGVPFDGENAGARLPVRG